MIDTWYIVYGFIGLVIGFYIGKYYTALVRAYNVANKQVQEDLKSTKLPQNSGDLY